MAGSGKKGIWDDVRGTGLTDQNAKVGSDEVQRRNVRHIRHDTPNARHHGRETDDGVQRRNSLRKVRRRDPLSDEQSYTCQLLTRST